MSSRSLSTQTMKTSVSVFFKFVEDYLFLATILEHAPLEAVYIYFDTATYDEIERDEKVTFRFRVCSSVNWHDDEFYLKVTMEAQLGLIGGTMGLLTGFSILSGVEIIYFLLRFLWFVSNISFTQSSGSLCLSRFQELLCLLSTRDWKTISQGRIRNGEIVL